MGDSPRAPQAAGSSWEIGAPGIRLPAKDLSCLLAIFAAFLLNNGLWLAKDRLNPVFDEAIYLSRSLEVLESLKTADLGSFRELYWQRFEVRPTLFFVALGAIVYLLLGDRGDFAILSTNGLAAGVLILAIYLLGRHFFDRRAGLLAAILVLCYPRVGFISRTYWPHFSTLAIAALGTWILFDSASLTKKRHLFAFGCVLGTGLMVRPIFPALLLVTAALWSSGAALLERLSGPLAARGDQRSIAGRLGEALVHVGWRWWPATIPVMAIAGPFYYRFLGSMRTHMHNVDELYRDKWPYRPSLSWYFEGLPGDLSIFFFALFLFGLGGCLRRWRSTAPLLVCLGGTYLLISLPKVKFFYYFASVYPLVALISAGGLSVLRSRTVRNGTILATVVISCWIAVSSAWNLPQPEQPMLKTILKTPRNGPDPVDWQIRRICKKIESLHLGSDRPVVGFIARSQVFDASTFRYLGRPIALEFEYRGVHRPLETLLSADFVVLEANPDLSLRELPSKKRNLGRSAIRESRGAFFRSHREVLTVSRGSRSEVILFQRHKKRTSREILSLGVELMKAQPEVAGPALKRWIRRLPQREHNLLSRSVLSTISELRSKGDFDTATRLLAVAKIWMPSSHLRFPSLAITERGSLAPPAEH